MSKKQIHDKTAMGLAVSGSSMETLRQVLEIIG